MSVVPDAIEPVVGWKAWTINQIGMLNSPQKLQVWVPGEKARALCSKRSGHYEWEPVDRAKSDPTLPSESPLTVFYTTRTTAAPFVPTQPRTVLPDWLEWGIRWVDDPVHSPVADDCMCGIHIAKERGLAQQYGDFIGEVAGWGRTIEGEHGWRVEFAYPVAFHVSNEKDAEGLLDYGVPLVRDEAPAIKRNWIIATLSSSRKKAK